MTLTNGGVTWTVVQYSRLLMVGAVLLFLIAVAGTGEVAAQHGEGIATACGVEATNSGLCEQDFSDHPGYVNGNHG